MPLAVSGYELSLFIHITAVMAGFGATFAESVMFPVALNLSPRHLPYVHRLQLTINRYFALPALLIVILTGVYQMSEGDWNYGDFWVSGTMTIVVIIAVLLLAYFIPADKRLQPMVERELADAGSGEVTLSEEYQRAARNEGIAGSITGILLVVAIFLMVTKPGL
jgi:amino acid permease